MPTSADGPQSTPSGFKEGATALSTRPKTYYSKNTSIFPSLVAIFSGLGMRSGSVSDGGVGGGSGAGGCRVSLSDSY